MKEEKYSKNHVALSKWMEENIPESLMVFSNLKKAWKKLRTSNVVERQMKEIDRQMMQ